MMKKGTPASPATALESRVTGSRPTSSTPLGNARTDLGVSLRRLQEIDDLGEFVFGLIHTGHIGKVTLGLLIGHIHLRSW